MDFIDALIAKAFSPSVELDRYAAIAEKAVSDSTRALINANSALAAIDESTIASIEDEVRKNLASIYRLYTSTGNNEDGAMTQKSITEELDAIKQRLNILENNI